MTIQSQITEPVRAILVLTNLPDQESAEKLAQYLVSSKLAACINILAPCTSIYEWQGSIARDTEVPMLIKAASAHYAALEAAIRERHPYELPEIIHVPVTGGLTAYLDWIVNS